MSLFVVHLLILCSRPPLLHAQAIQLVWRAPVGPQQWQERPCSGPAVPRLRPHVCSAVSARASGASSPSSLWLGAELPRVQA